MNIVADFADNSNGYQSLKKQLSLETAYGLSEEEMFDVYNKIRKYIIQQGIINSYYWQIRTYNDSQKAFLINKFDLEKLYEDFLKNNTNFLEAVDDSMILDNVVSTFIYSATHDDELEEVKI